MLRKGTALSSFVKNNPAASSGEPGLSERQGARPSAGLLPVCKERDKAGEGAVPVWLLDWEAELLERSPPNAVRVVVPGRANSLRFGDVSFKRQK